MNGCNFMFYNLNEGQKYEYNNGKQNLTAFFVTMMINLCLKAGFAILMAGKGQGGGSVLASRLVSQARSAQKKLPGRGLEKPNRGREIFSGRGVQPPALFKVGCSPGGFLHNPTRFPAANRHRWKKVRIYLKQPQLPREERLSIHSVAPCINQRWTASCCANRPCLPFSSAV
jgi:hypothetical protein